MFSPSAITNRPAPLAEEDGRSSRSSGISSPPLSECDDIRVAFAQPGVAAANHGGIPASATPAQPDVAAAAAHNANTTLVDHNATATAAKPKRQRKPKEPKLEGQDGKPAKEKKPRKPREPKVKKEGGEAAAPRKRLKTEDKATPAPPDALAAPRQSTLTEMVNHFHPPGIPASAPQPVLLSQPQQYQPPTHSPLPRSQPTPSDSLLRSSLPPHTSNPPTPRPYSSGQNYDPIRGATIDSAPSRPPPTNTTTHSAQPSPHLNRASASPSITSLIDPPSATNTSAPTMSHVQQTLSQQYHPPASFLTSQQPSPTPPRAAPVPQPTTVPTKAPASPSQTFQAPKSMPASMDGAMEIDGPACGPPTKPTQAEMKTSKSSSSAPTPKPAPVKVNSPPKATGSGLLSSSDLFGGPSSDQDTGRKGTDIEIRITLNPSGGNTINMAQEIARKYGRDAINPRAAAHRQRLLEVAAAANKIDGGSADDMSVDLLSEADGDSNVEMGGIDGDKSATGADDKPVRKRRKKVEEYDKEDDFIDDTELAWQEQAAVAKDGFFVYSGPLVPEGQTAQVESTTSTRGSRGGRGRGRGRAAAAAAAAAGATHASVTEKNKDPNAPSTGRGRGRGRGTGAPRKPRITKADRERMEAEKAERERVAGGGGMQTSTASMALAPPSNVPANASMPAQSQPTPAFYANVHPPGTAAAATATATTQSGPGVSV